MEKEERFDRHKQWRCPICRKVIVQPPPSPPAPPPPDPNLSLELAE